jgi:hypothetical protein
MSTIRPLAAATLLVLTASLSLTAMLGCRFESNRKGDGEDMKIATPFGGMSVKTNDNTVLQGIGLPPYPGAELVKKKDKDNGAADVNLSFGNFQLRVKAVSYRTTDSPEQVAAFYRKALGRYGDVIQCSNNKPVGTPARTAEGLGCDNEKENHLDANNDVSGKMQLKAGSKVHQHIVAIDPEDSGTKFGMVALDLPSHITLGNDKSDASQ